MRNSGSHGEHEAIKRSDAFTVDNHEKFKRNLRIADSMNSSKTSKLADEEDFFGKKIGISAFDNVQTNINDIFNHGMLTEKAKDKKK